MKLALHGYGKMGRAVDAIARQRGHDVVAVLDKTKRDINGAEVMNPPPDAFTPSATSPLRNAGYAGDATIQIPQGDFFGNPRDTTPNIGAIE